MARRAVLLPLVLALLAGPALASETCERLRGELADLPEVIGSTRSAHALSSTIAAQQREITRLKTEMRRMRCPGSGSSIMVINGPDAWACAEDGETLRQLEASRDALVAEKNGAVDAAETDERRLTLLAALDENGCNDEEVPPEEAAPMDEALAPPGPADGIGMGYRTICVRLCDGGFFPISVRTSPAFFGRDAAACAKRCPASETELYVGPSASADVGAFTSADTGSPYASLASAFAFRNRPSGTAAPGCGCKAGSIRTVTTAAASPPRHVPGPARPYQPGAAPVRQVGPHYLPSEPETIDLAHPRLTGPQPLQ